MDNKCNKGHFNNNSSYPISLLLSMSYTIHAKHINHVRHSASIASASTHVIPDSDPMCLRTGKVYIEACA